MAPLFPWSNVSFALLFIVAFGMSRHLADPVPHIAAVVGFFLNVAIVGWRWARRDVALGRAARRQVEG